MGGCAGLVYFLSLYVYNVSVNVKRRRIRIVEEVGVDIHRRRRHQANRRFLSLNTSKAKRGKESSRRINTQVYYILRIYSITIKVEKHYR